MTSEKSTWSDHVRPILAQARLDPVRIENVVDLGTPDINITHGWIELKYVAEWPKRTNTILRIHHFTPQQRVWLRRRWVAGGGAFFLLKIADEFLLFDGETAYQVGKLLTREQCYATALHHAKHFSYDFVKYLAMKRISVPSIK